MELNTYLCQYVCGYYSVKYTATVSAPNIASARARMREYLLRNRFIDPTSTPKIRARKLKPFHMHVAIEPLGGIM